MATSMTNGLCLAFTALQIKPETSNSNRSVLSEIDTKPRARSNSFSNNHHDHHNHKHKRLHTRNSISADAHSTSSTNTTTTTTSAATSITSSIIAGVVGTVRGIADGISNSIATTTNSVCSKVGVAEDQENVRPTFSREEVSDHCTSESCWIIINNRVYDVTRFLAMHPGGEDIILEYGGHDATSGFIDKGHSPDAFDMLGDYCIGEIEKAEWYPEKNYT